MSSLRDEIQSLLKPGFSLVDNRILDAQGKVVRDGDQPINIKHSSGYHYKRRLFAQLTKAGVIRRTRSSSTAPKRESIPHEKTKKNPLLLAAEILRDPKASPRERGIARAYNDLFARHTRVTALSRALGRELRERGE